MSDIYVSLGTNKDRQAEIRGKKSRASPGPSAAGAAAGTIGTELGKMAGFPGLGGFARGLPGGLLR
jgi:hypothetical protein